MRIPDFSKVRVFVFGDIMLDEYVVGDVSRISPEAPIQVLLYRSKYQVPGGASNVAANLAALGAKVVLCGVVGDDLSGRGLRDAIATRCENVDFRPVVDVNRSTTVKTRYLSGGHHILRVDAESSLQISTEISQAIIHEIGAAVRDSDAVIVSDYAKGAVVQATYRAIADAASRFKVPVFVDPKRRDLTFYRGASYLTPNRRELQDATGLAVSRDDEIELACRAAASTTGASILVTRSEDGMSLFQAGSPVFHIHSAAREVFDVSGAGDTVIATFASAIATGLPAEEAAALANIAAGISVSKQGTSTVTAAELDETIRSVQHPGVGRVDGFMSAAAAADQCRKWREDGLVVAFTNGCFDILHSGHVQLLDEVARRCGRLIVGLNSDASVRQLKGPSRPVNTAEARARVLLALRSVDAVVVFEEETPAKLIEMLSPDILAKGGDYKRHEIVGADHLEKTGGTVMIVPLVPGVSTTSIIHNAQIGGKMSSHAAE